MAGPRLNHVGISVRDLERAAAFYARWFGFEVAGSFDFDDLPWMNRVTALGLTRGRAIHLRSADGYLELFEFAEPAPAPAAAPAAGRPVSDPGLTHLGFEVDDVVALQAQMAAAGVPFHSEPQDAGDGSLTTYGHDPDGNVFELMQLGGESIAFSVDALPRR
jgi:catechol 2,3-dioxygenase-like lactoylglutathione lyase family enzyme